MPGLGRFCGEENGNPLQYSCLENSMDRGAWRANSPWGCKESDTTEQLTSSLSFIWVHLKFTYYCKSTIVVQLLGCVQLCNSMDFSTLGFPVLHCLPEFAQIHDQLSQWWYLIIFSSAALFFCPQSFPASESFPMSWLFDQVAKVLELQCQSFQWLFRVDFL